MILPSRRRFLAGLFCAPAIISVAKLMAVRSWGPAPEIVAYGIDVGLGDKTVLYEIYTSHFRWMPYLPPRDWRYVARIANIEAPERWTEGRERG